MLKYLYTKELFAEIPSEITLGVSISGCRLKCPGCHSTDLWEDKGTVLTIQELRKLINQHKGITCLLLLGGEHDIDTLIELFKDTPTRLRKAWYCGLDIIPKDKKDILKYLNYVKIGHYDDTKGGLTSPDTNQRFYNVHHINKEEYTLEDTTEQFYKK